EAAEQNEEEVGVGATSAVACAGGAEGGAEGVAGGVAGGGGIASDLSTNSPLVSAASVSGPPSGLAGRSWRSRRSARESKSAWTNPTCLAKLEEPTPPGCTPSRSSGGFPPIVTPSPDNPMGSRTAPAPQNASTRKENLGAAAHDKGFHADEANPTGDDTNKPAENESGGAGPGARDKGASDDDASKQKQTKVYPRISKRGPNGRRRGFRRDRDERVDGRGGGVELAEHALGDKSPMYPPPG
ncbi:unnamed protein product, partial [Laminaria digitata]